MIKADGKPDRVSVRVTAGQKRMKGVRVVVQGAGVRKSATSNGKGVAVLRINARKAGIITITAQEPNQKVCGLKRIGVVGSSCRRSRASGEGALRKKPRAAAVAPQFLGLGSVAETAIGVSPTGSDHAQQQDSVQHGHSNEYPAGIPPNRHDESDSDQTVARGRLRGDARVRDRAVARPGAGAGPSSITNVDVAGSGTIAWHQISILAEPNARAKRLAVLKQFRSDFRPQYVLALDVLKAKKTGKPTWYRISIPGRPNGLTGWVRAGALEIHPVQKRLIVYRGAKRSSTGTDASSCVPGRSPSASREQRRRSASSTSPGSSTPRSTPTGRSWARMPSRRARTRSSRTGPAEGSSGCTALPGPRSSVRRSPTGVSECTTTTSSSCATGFPRDAGQDRPLSWRGVVAVSRPAGPSEHESRQEFRAHVERVAGER